MRASPGYLYGLALISRTCARELTQNHGLRRRAEDGILDAGIGAVRGICDPLVSECTSNDMQIKEELTAAIGSRAQVTGEALACPLPPGAAHDERTARVLPNHRRLCGRQPCSSFTVRWWCSLSSLITPPERACDKKNQKHDKPV